MRSMRPMGPAAQTGQPTHSTPPAIAVMGAPGTGAQELAQALQAHLTPGAALVVHSTAVVDALSWQGADLAKAVGAGPTHAEGTTPSGALDALHLLQAALQWHRGTAINLVMGLDTPCSAQARLAQEACDTQLRQALAEGQVAYRVVYGQGPSRLKHALDAIQSVATSAFATSARSHFGVTTETQRTRLRAWDCEKCSDPECEHRLFTSLIEAREGFQPGA